MLAFENYREYTQHGGTESTEDTQEERDLVSDRRGEIDHCGDGEVKNGQK